MAYTVVITKGEVSKRSNVLYSVGINVVINDGVSDIFTKSYSMDYNSNAPDMDAMLNSIRDDIKDDWDKFVEEKNLHDAQAFDNMLATLQSQATTYVNQ